MPASTSQSTKLAPAARLVRPFRRPVARDDLPLTFRDHIRLGQPTSIGGRLIDIATGALLLESAVFLLRDIDSSGPAILSALLVCGLATYVFACAVVGVLPTFGYGKPLSTGRPDGGRGFDIAWGIAAFGLALLLSLQHRDRQVVLWTLAIGVEALVSAMRGKVSALRCLFFLRGNVVSAVCL